MRHHHEQDKKATLIAVLPADRFGALSVLNNDIIDFVEKPQGDNNWINRDFFILNPSVIDYIRSDETIWEQEPLKQLAGSSELSAFYHSGFRQPMDTLRDKTNLEELWRTGKALWKVW